MFSPSRCLDHNRPHHDMLLASMLGSPMLGSPVREFQISHQCWAARSGNSRFPGREIRILGCEKFLVQMIKWKQESGNRNPQPLNGSGLRVRDSARVLGESCADKNEGPHPKKTVWKSRNSCRLNSGGGSTDSDSNGLSPIINQYKRSKTTCCLTLLALPLASHGIKLLELPASNCWSFP